MTKLKTVSVTFEFVIVVDTDADAIKVAKQTVQDAFKEYSLDELEYDIIEYKDHLPNGWTGDCYPYGGDYTKTIYDYLKEQDDKISNVGIDQ